MNHVYSLLEEKNLITSERVESSFHRWSSNDAISLRDALLEALQQDKRSLSEPSESVTAGEFRFYAGTSIRGDFGCDEWGCRKAKAANLARYAALYCESLVVPVRMDLHAGERPEFRATLAGTICCLLEYRAAAEAGIVQLVPDVYYLCPDCEKDLTERCARSEQITRQFVEQNEGQFSVVFAPRDSEIPLTRLEITAPEDYLEHGLMISIFFQEPEWVKTLGRNGPPKSRYKLTPTEMRRTGIVKSTLGRLIGDAVFQQTYSVACGTKFLTNLPAQAQVLSILNSDQYMAECTSGLLANMTHEVPILNELPTATVVRIREEEPDSFLQYRAALTKILTEYVKGRKHVAPSEAKQIYSDVLLPEILKLQSQAKNYRKGKLGKAFKQATYSVIAVSLGLFGGLPAGLAAALTAAGATSLLRDLHDAVTENQKAGAEIRNENFYFLLKLLRETE